MLKIIGIILVVFFIIITGAIAYLFLVDPLNVFNSDQPALNGQSGQDQQGQTDKNPLLSDQQEKILETIGIDVASLPTEITPELEKCFIDQLGQERADELIKGATPGPLDVFKAKSCLGN